MRCKFDKRKNKNLNKKKYKKNNFMYLFVMYINIYVHLFIICLCIYLFSLYVQWWTKYLRQTLVFMWNSTLRENFNFYFSAAFWWYSQNFFLLFMSLLTAQIIKNSVILARSYLIFLKIHPRPNLKVFQYQI